MVKSIVPPFISWLFSATAGLGVTSVGPHTLGKVVFSLLGSPVRKPLQAVVLLPFIT